jgi:hypothetical protein
VEVRTLARHDSSQTHQVNAKDWKDDQKRSQVKQREIEAEPLRSQPRPSQSAFPDYEHLDTSFTDHDDIPYFPRTSSSTHGSSRYYPSPYDTDGNAIQFSAGVEDGPDDFVESLRHVLVGLAPAQMWGNDEAEAWEDSKRREGDDGDDGGDEAEETADAEEDIEFPLPGTLFTFLTGVSF